MLIGPGVRRHLGDQRRRQSADSYRDEHGKGRKEGRFIRPGVTIHFVRNQFHDVQSSPFGFFAEIFWLFRQVGPVAGRRDPLAKC